MVGGSCSVNQAEEKRKLALKTTMSLQMAGVVFFWKSYLFNGSTNFDKFVFSLFLFSPITSKLFLSGCDKDSSLQSR